jgi:transmembrane sensor
MTEAEYLSLCEKYLNGDCTPQQEEQIQTYQQKFGIANWRWNNREMGDQEQLRTMIYERLQNSMSKQKQVSLYRFKWRYAVAATVLLFISAGLFFLTPKTAKPVIVRANVSPKYKNDVLPGSNKAVLTLADGRRIILDNAKKGMLLRQGNTAITKSRDGLLVYNFQSVNSSTTLSNPMNTISIPRGGKYQIVLPDGSKVWLNSSSKLTFPTYFTGTQRNVQLAGEAYLEVAKKNGMPFTVKLSNNTEVKVLGTHFNITDYDDDSEIKTTLLEGSVKLSNTAGSVMLVPNQQGVTGRGEQAGFKITEANTEAAIAWKEGNFMFVNEDLKSIMKKISRWYDVDIAYSNNITDRNFTGTISQFKNVSEVLRLLQLTGAVHFKIEERRIYVMQ